MGDAFRPADRVSPGSQWNYRNATFDLAELDRATQIAVLRQWALAPMLRAEITGVAGSAQAFVRTHGGSINHVRNMLNGHRLADYATLALVVSTIDPSRLPDENVVRKTITDAYRRSTPPQGANKPGPSRGYVSGKISPTDSSGQSEHLRMHRPHPDAEKIRDLFGQLVREHPLTQAYLAASNSSEGASLQNEVEVFLASPGQEDAEGYIAGTTISGTIWVAMDWRDVSLPACGAPTGGAFVLRSRHGSRLRAIEIFVEAGGSPENWDVSFHGADATLRQDGALVWAQSQHDGTESLPIHDRQQEADR